MDAIDETDSAELLEQDAYFSVDVETDGPIPGEFSMLSFAIVEAGHHDGKRYVGPDFAESKYWELKPITPNFEAAAIEVNGLDRELLSRTGRDPAAALAEAAEWVRLSARGRRPVLVASPVGFDWMFMHWYFVKFIGTSPFGHSSAFDLKTAISVRFDRPIALSGRRHFPDWMDSDIEHSHNALDDARKQALNFETVREWQGTIEAYDND